MSRDEVKFVNDNGILCLFGETNEEYLFMERQPPEIELHPQSEQLKLKSLRLPLKPQPKDLSRYPPSFVICQ